MWAVLQLREGLNLSLPVSELEREFRRHWPHSTFLFPAVRHGCLDAANPMSGYVLVEPPVEASVERSPLVCAVLKDPVSRQPFLVTDAELAVMAPLTVFPAPGTSVQVTVGDYQGLEGTVVEVNCNACKVLVELWSRTVVLTLAADEFRSV